MDKFEELKSDINQVYQERKERAAELRVEEGTDFTKTFNAGAASAIDIVLINLKSIKIDGKSIIDNP